MDLPKTATRCKCQDILCQLCKKDWEDYLVTAEYIWEKLQPLFYKSPFTQRTGKVGLADDLEKVIKTNVKSQELMKLLGPLSQRSKL
jgi:hypothetical protein